MTYALTPAQVQAAIAGHDLSTFKGWTAAARALLANAPDWTAIKDSDVGYTVAVDGEVYAIASELGGDSATYSEELLVDIDESAWDRELGSWEGSIQASSDTLKNPVFVTLRHK